MQKIIDKLMIEGDEVEFCLRPRMLDEYIGQDKLKKMLKVYITSARSRGESLDHVLLFGPAGLGKTTLSHIIANEMGTKLISTTGPALKRAGDVASILCSLEPGDILFIDEIHRISKVVEEMLYSAMEDFKIDLIVSKDSGAKTIRIDLPPFTLVGATTRIGDLTKPFRDRFGIIESLSYYTIDELGLIIKRSSKVLDYAINDDAVVELSKRSRGTPRIANRLFRRIRDFAQYDKVFPIDINITLYALDMLCIDKLGLDVIDRLYLDCLVNKFKGGPTGIASIASAISEEKVTLEDVVEPFLLQSGFILRTPRGRIALEKAIKYFKK